MGAFKIQTDLDLSGFNLLNFCIQSYTDLENVPNLGLGRKLFFTGNSTDEKNLREVIWDGVEWKAAAYLDDIEAITNGEGSLGTRVKALEDMLGLEDVTDVIDTWNDVKEFFANVDEGLDLMGLLNSKLDKTGGIMAENAAITWGAEGGPFIRGNGAGGLFLSSSVLQYRTLDGNNIYDILHSGNAGDYAALKDGSNASGTWGIDISGTADKAKVLYEPVVFQNLTDGMTRFQKRGVILTHTIPSTADGVFPTESYGNSMLTINRHGDSGSSSQLGFAANGKLYYRLLSLTSSSAVPTDWKTIAFTDSTVAAAYKLVNPSTNADVVTIDDAGTVSIANLNVETITAKTITGNATTATKLKTAVSLWGNAFDGTQSLSGNIIMPVGKEYKFRDDNGSMSALSLGSTSENLIVGFGTNEGERTIKTYLDGYKLYFRTGAKRTAMTITEEGNVLIGCQTNNLDAIIETKGLVHIEGGSTNTALGSAPVHGLTIGYDTIGGLAQWIHATNFSGNIQAMNLAGTATAYALNLNPLGGAINLGTNVHVGSDGQLYVGTKVSTDAAFTVSGGRSELAATGVTPSLEALPSSGLVVGSLANALLMYLDSSNGLYNIQAQATNSKVAKGLYINPLGGKVSIASADASTIVKGGLSVAGIASVATTLTVGASDGTSVAAIYLQRASNNYIWANKAGGTLHLGVADSGNTSNANASLSIASDKIYPGIRNNAVSLGTSSYRWSNVYSVGGDFSGRVFIGSADDDTHSALLVKGGLGVTGNTFVYSNDKSSRIVTTIADNIARIYSLSQDGSVARDMYFGDYSGKGVKIIGGSRVLIGGATDDENYKLITNGAIKIGRSNYTDTYLGITISDTLATFDGNDGDGYMNYSFKSNGNNLLFLTGKSGGTSIFYTPTFFENLATFNGGALIPTGQKMTFGANGPTMEYDADANAIKVTGNIYATGTMASGGKAAEGEGDTGGGGNANVYSDVLEGVITQEWEVGNPFQKEDVIVSLYMWNTDESRWEMVLADIGVTSENIWVTFGRPTSTTDKYMAVVMG